jgi:hypothetical protein
MNIHTQYLQNLVYSLPLHVITYTGTMDEHWFRVFESQSGQACVHFFFSVRAVVCS